MKFTFSPDWCLAAANREEDHEIGVGPRSPAPSQDQDIGIDPGTRLAFGRLVQLMRRKLRLSIEQLAEKTSVDVEAILRIEDDLHHVPEPRTVYQLATIFKLPKQPFAQLSGLTVEKNVRLHQEAVRFAARSDSVAALTAEEQLALDQFVRVLSEQVEQKGPPER